MKREKEFRKIKYALKKSRHKKKSKYKMLNAAYKNLLTLSSYIWSLGNKSGNDKKENTAKATVKKEDAEERSATIIELTEFACLTEGSPINYHDNDGYIYSKHFLKKNTLYIRCKNAVGKSCASRVIVKGNNLKAAKLVCRHNHRPDGKAVDRTKFSRTLEKVCLENPHMLPVLCYTTAKKELQGQITNSNIPGPYKYNMFIHRMQKKTVPLLPKSIEEFEKLIRSVKTTKLYAYDNIGKIFYRGVWEGRTGRNIAFVSERTLNEIAKMEEITLLMDGTFRSVPKHLKFRQLYIINVIIRDRCYPLAFILMEKKDFHSYDLVLNEIKKLVPTINVVNCMTDYEAATRKAIKKVFPSSRISGCFFHYVQAIQKASKRFGLRNKAFEGDFERAINKTSALALLPNEFIVDGFKTICKSVQKSSRWDRFSRYWNKQWANANISVYGLRHRTNNFSETLNRMINLLIGRKNPNIWLLIVNLRTVESLKSDELEQVLDGLLMDKKIKKETARLNKKIKKALKRFKKTKDVQEFLDIVTHKDDLPSFFVHDFKEVDYIEDFDEEVVPNTYNDECNFRKKTHRGNAKKQKPTHK